MVTSAAAQPAQEVEGVGRHGNGGGRSRGCGTHAPKCPGLLRSPIGGHPPRPRLVHTRAPRAAALCVHMSQHQRTWGMFHPDLWL